MEEKREKRQATVERGKGHSVANSVFQKKKGTKKILLLAFRFSCRIRAARPSWSLNAIYR